MYMDIENQKMGVDWTGQRTLSKQFQKHIINRASQVVQNLTPTKTVTTSTVFPTVNKYGPSKITQPLIAPVKESVWAKYFQPSSVPRQTAPPSAVQRIKSPDEKLLETSWQWKAFPANYFQAFSRQYWKSPNKFAFRREIENRVRSWTPNFIPYVKKMNPEQIRMVGLLFPSIKGMIPQLLIEKDLPFYIEKMTTLAEDKEGSTLEKFIGDVKANLKKYAPDKFMESLPERIGKPFADTFLQDEINQNVLRAGFGTGGDFGKIAGFAVLGILGLALLPKIGGKKRGRKR